jgi:DtxR family Mn-dependent transcriptional regulator
MVDASTYLIVIYAAEQEDETPIAPGRIADAVERSPAATTEMLQRLDDRGLVVHEPYEGTELTAEGRATAADLYETYRTLARFFREVLDLEDPDGEAMELAGSVSSRVTERLAAVLLEGADSQTSSDALSAEGS